jgi:hypothetical protein
VPVKIVGERLGKQQPVEQATIIDTIERNRDRVRSLVTMMISTISILFSANIAILILLVDKIKSTGFLPRLLGTLSLVFLLVALITCMMGAFLRRNYTLVSMTKFINDLFSIYYRELRIVRIAFSFLILGLISLFGFVISIVLQKNT